jgi:hypothetical protein
MSTRNNLGKLPPLSPEQERQALLGEQMRREQPVMSFEELRRQTGEPSRDAMDARKISVGNSIAIAPSATL